MKAVKYYRLNSTSRVWLSPCVRTVSVVWRIEESSSFIFNYDFSGFTSLCLFTSLLVVLNSWWPFFVLFCGFFSGYPWCLSHFTRYEFCFWFVDEREKIVNVSLEELLMKSLPVCCLDTCGERVNVSIYRPSFYERRHVACRERMDFCRFMMTRPACHAKQGKKIISNSCTLLVLPSLISVFREEESEK